MPRWRKDGGARPGQVTTAGAPRTRARRRYVRVALFLALIAAAAIGLGVWLRGAEQQAHQQRAGLGGAAGAQSGSAGQASSPGAFPSPAASPSGKETAAEFTQIFIAGRQDGVKQWEFRANQVQVLQDRSGGNEEYLLKAIKSGVIYRDGKPYLRFEAGKASYDRAKNDFLLTEGLEVRSTEGDSMKSASVFWDAARERLIGRSPVEMSLKGTSVQAPTWEVDVKAEVLEAHGGVILRSDTVEGRMEGIRYDFRKRETEFLGLEELNLVIEKKPSEGKRGGF